MPPGFCWARSPGWVTFCFFIRGKVEDRIASQILIMVEPFGHFLTVLTFLPLAGALSIAFIRPDAASRIRWVALIYSLATLVLAILAFTGFDPNQAGFQLTEQQPWIMSPRISYSVGVDGLSLLLVLLSAFLTPLSILASWRSIHVRTKEFYLFLSRPETGMIGVFVSLDLFLFFMFWEVMLIPMYFLIGVWGHERRVYAAVKFILYTMVGSALMLVGILYLTKLPGHSIFRLSFKNCRACGLPFPARRKCGFSRFLRCLRHQSPHVSVPYLAT